MLPFLQAETGSSQNMAIKTLIAGILLCLVTPFFSYGQTTDEVRREHCRELGIPLIHNYYSYNFGGFQRSGDITQDKDGLIYFSNFNGGCFSFNGSGFSHFRLFPDTLVEKEITLTGLTIIKDTMWISSGNYGKLVGYVTRDEQGQFSKSMLKLILLPDSLSDYGGIYAIEELDGDKYVLKSGEVLVRIRTGELTTWAVEGYRNIFKIHNKLYIPAEDSLYVLENDRLQAVFDWDTRSMGWVRAMLPMEDGSILVASPTIIYKYDGDTLQPVNDLGKLIPNAQIWRGTALRDGHYALGSLGHGIYVVDAQGRLCMNINMQHGLGANTTSDLFYSSSGQLWVSHNNGLSLIDLSSPLTYFDLNHGLTNYLRDVIRVGERLYTGSRGGLSYLDADGLEPVFKRITYLPDFSLRSFRETASGYFATTNNGVFQLYPDTVIQVVENNSYAGLLQLLSDSTLYLLKKNMEVELVERVGTAWINHGVVLEAGGEVDMLEDKYGNVWIMGYPLDGLYRIQFDPRESIKEQLINRTYRLRHFPESSWPSLIGQEVYISSDSTMLKFDPVSDSFLPDPILVPENGKPLSDIYRIIEGKQNDLWIYSRVRHIKKFPGNDSLSEIRPSIMYWHAVASDSGRYVWDNEPFRFLQSKLEFLNLIYPDRNGIVWFAGTNVMLARYNPAARKAGNSLSRLMINEIRLPGQDSILFSGNARKFEKGFFLEPHMRDIRIRYNVVDFIASDSVFFRYRLEGFENKWSAWTHENTKDYTGLGPGEYTFFVQATDYYGENLVQASFDITKYPPWYTSWPAIFVYILIMAWIIYMIFRWRLKTLHNEKLKLEKIIESRTYLLEKQSSELRELNEAKNRFFSNISHEFRTPLTLILGYIQKLFRSDHSSERSGTYRNLDRNARQLLQLVNQLLELARLESGRISASPVATSLYEVCKRLIAAYTSLAESRNIFLAFDFTMDKDMYVTIDADKFRSVIQNLISNAFKFTHSGGKITLAVRMVRLVENQVTFQCKVKDTGKGIPEEHVERIFERFYQVEPNYSEYTFGTGIGLSIVRDYVRLMEGEISVRSRPGHGSEFTLTFTKPLAAVRRSTGEVEDIVPVYDPEPAMEEETTEQEEGVNILVVEDNSSMREYIRDILAGSSYNVVLANDGRHGLDLAIRILPDLVISDVMMPKMDGMQLLAELKGDIRTSHIPVIMLTALSEKKNRFKGLQHGADDYLIKPFDEEELKILISNRIEQRKSLREKWSYNESLIPDGVSSLDEKFLCLVQASVEENLGDSQFGVNDLAAAVSMSRSQLHRKLTSLTNYSAGNYIKSMRLQRAYLLLQANSGTVSEIAYEVGFSSPQYFSECFRNHYGQPPGKLRNHIPQKQ